MRFNRSAVCLSILMCCLVSPAFAVLDEVGSTGSSANSSPFYGKGNAFRVDASTTLTQQEFFLNFNGSKQLSFYVYTSPSQLGTYTQVQTNSMTVLGTGSGWYSSGAINVPLQAGQYYITAFSMPGAFTYYFTGGLEFQNVSFGQQVHGFTSGTDPLGATISSTADNKAIFYQRLTTEVTPEPASAMILALGAGLLIRRKHSA